jgi:glycogen synthase
MAIVSRLTHQKGLDLLIRVIDEVMDMDVQLVILGTGEYYYEHALWEAADRNKQKMRTLLTFNEALAHKIYASSDLFLMPSLFEPCGLSQLIALRYGSLPVVRETGGLADTVRSYNEVTGEGNGFTFTNFNAHDFLNTIRRAVDIYENQWNVWTKIVKCALKSNFDWTDSARKYFHIYETLLGGQEYKVGLALYKAYTDEDEVIKVKVLSDEVIKDEVITDKAIIGKAIIGKAITDKAATDKFFNQVSTDEVPADKIPEEVSTDELYV